MLLDGVMEVVATGCCRIPLPSRPSVVLELALNSNGFGLPRYEREGGI